MPYAITCEIKPGVLTHLMELRLNHLEYIRAHREDILFGGPARSSQGLPETMIIVLATDDLRAATDFIQQEPYNASGEVFGEVKVRPWSQVIPPSTKDALETAIEMERERQVNQRNSA